MRTHLILIFVLLCASLAVAQVTVQSFDGLSAGSLGATKSFNADANGAVGTKQYLEWVNSAYQGYNKTTFAKVFPSPVMGDTPWRNAGMPDCFGSGGDGIILFDHLASRWVIGTRHGQGTYFYCIAVSNSDDLTAPGFGWSAYELPLNPILGQNSLGHAYFADFPRLGTWADGYYVSIDLEDPDNGFREVGVVVCAFDRTSMLAGATARTPQCFRNPSTITGSLFLVGECLEILQR